MSKLKRMRPLLGTFVEIGCEQSDKSAEHAIAAAFDVVEKLHHLLSFHEQASDLSRLNQAEGKAVVVHQHTLRVMKLARAMTAASNGLFNCTLGGAMVQNGVLPNHSSLNPDGAETKASGVANDIQINAHTIKLSNSIKITLDGIAKGYAVDCAIAQLKRFGIKAAWVNAGGDLRVYGDLLLPIQRREISGEFVSLGGLHNAAIATSTVTIDYNNDFPGKIIGSLASPTIGSWTVMSHYAWRADALTKVACLAEATDRGAIIERLGGKIVTI